jgi:ribosomal protein S18 acetylase RimI-like enzyme
VWRKSGYALFHRLIVMEASTAARNRVGTSNAVRIVVDPDWARIDIVDRAAFEGFWRLGVAGLRESALATRHSVVLEVEQEASLLGFAIVGAERGVSYLQRIAVTPQHARRGVGSELLSRAIDWARGIGAPIMVLNVREETEPALNLYRTFGFDVTPTRLEILEYRRTPDTLLN